jgi:rhodanese-related sulfurtransferase
LHQLEQRLSEIAAYKNKDILVYCRSGNRSTVASEILISNGFKKPYNLHKGIIGWKNEGKTVVK